MMILSPNVGSVTKYPINVGIGPVIRSVLADYTPNAIKYPGISDSGSFQTEYKQFTGIDSTIRLRILTNAPSNISVSAYIGQINNDPYLLRIIPLSNGLPATFDFFDINPNEWLSFFFEDTTGDLGGGTLSIANATLNNVAIDSFNYNFM